MAINSSKLLPSSNMKGVLNKTSMNASMITLSEKSIGEIKVIRTKVIEVEKLFKGTLVADKKELDRKKSEDNREGREKEEKKLEKPKTDSKSIKDKMPKVPGLGILGWIKNFIGNILLGYFATRMIDHLPKLMPMVSMMGKAADFLIDFGGKFLNGFVTFIDVAYKAYDWTRGALKKIGGDGLVENFDKFIKAVDIVITMLTVAALSKGLGLDKGFRKGARGGRGGRPRVTQGRGGQRPIGRPRVTQGRGGQRSGGRPRITGAPRGGFKPKFRGPKGVPILGTIFSIFDFAERKSAGQTNVQAGAGVGGGILGSIAGAAIAATLFPEPTTTAAGLITLGVLSTLGYSIGGAASDKATGAKYAGGGRVGGPKRTLGKAKTQKQKARVVRKPTQFQIIPGSDVGGQENVEKNYNPLSRLFEEDGPAKFLLDGVKKVPVIGGFVDAVMNKLNPTEMIKSAGEKLFSIDFFGPILGVASQILLGQKPRDIDFKNVGYGINMLIQEGIVKKRLLGGVASAYAEGGLVDSKTLEAISSGGDISDWVAKSFKSSVTQESGKIISDIQSNIALANQPLYGAEGASGGLGGAAGEGGANLDSGPGGGPTTISGSNEQKWKAFYAMAQRAGAKYPELVAAQFALESGWGTALSGTHNYFGIKAAPGESSTMHSTKEEYGGKVVTVKAGFKNFNSPQDAVNHLVNQWYKDYKNYKGVNRAADAYAAAQMLKSQGYATDSRYVAKLHDMLKRYGSIRGTQADIGMIKESGGAGSSDMQLGKGYGTSGGKLAGELGRFLKKKLKAGAQYSQIHRHPEHPPYSLTSGHSQGSYHYSGRALDIGAYTYEQGPILAAIAEFNRMKGVKPVQLLHGKNEPKNHSNHVHIAYASGGLTHDYPHIAMLGEEGTEIVIDADSSGPAKNMLLAINQAKGFDGVMKAISDYAPYDHMVPQTIIIEDEVDDSGYGSDTMAYSLPISAGGGGEDPFEFLDYQG